MDNLKKFKVSLYEDVECKKLTTSFIAMSNSKTEIQLFAQAICNEFHVYKTIEEI